MPRFQPSAQARSAVAGSALLLLIVAPLYLATVVTGARLNVDSEAAALPAWRLTQHGSIDLKQVDTANPWIVTTADGRRVSNRAPGTWLVAVPAYALAGDDGFSELPSTGTAVALTLGAVVVLHLVLRRCVTPGWALIGALVFALGTATWPISSAELWPHGTGQLILGLALLAAASRRTGWSSLAMGLEVVVRPVSVVMPAVISLCQAADRRWRTAANFGAAAAVGLGLVVLYNGWAFGAFSLFGANPNVFRENLTGQSPIGYVTNLGGFFISAHHGLLIWTPVIGAALLGLRRAWPDIPSWARQSAIAGLVYVMVHARLNRVSGGLAFDYRYPLEALTLATPLLVMSARSFAELSERRRQVLILAAITSIFLQGLVAFTYHCDEAPGRDAQCSLLWSV